MSDFIKVVGGTQFYTYVELENETIRWDGDGQQSARSAQEALDRCLQAFEQFPDAKRIYYESTQVGELNLDDLADMNINLLSSTIGGRIQRGQNTNTAPVGQIVINDSSPLPNADVNTPYQHQLTGSNGNAGTFFWSIASGTLPAGLTMNAAGWITGTPTGSGTANFTVSLIDGINTEAQKAFALSVNVPPQIFITSPGTLSPATQNTAYSFQLAATGGTPGSYVWTVITGALPTGLSLSTSGLISGTPTTLESQAFTIQCTDGTYTDTLNASLTVSSATTFATITWDFADRAAMLATPNYENGGTAGGVGGSTARPITLATPGPWGGTKCLENFFGIIPPTAQPQVGMHYYLPDGATEIWLQTWVKWSSSWDGINPDNPNYPGNQDYKTLFIWEGAGGPWARRWEVKFGSFGRQCPCSAGDHDISYGYMSDPPYSNGSYLYGIPQQFQTYNLADRIFADSFWDDTWRELKIHAKMSSTDSANDGWFDVWWDGVLVGFHHNFPTYSANRWFDAITFGGNRNQGTDTGAGSSDEQSSFFGPCNVWTYDQGW